MKHIPVMLHQVIHYLKPENGGIFVDCTFGTGGHTESILQYNETTVIAIDRDSNAEKTAYEMKKKYKNRFFFFSNTFSNLSKILTTQGIDTATGIFVDLGVSSPQLLTPLRGFSFLQDGPLDMRMGHNKRSAETLINSATVDELFDIILNYGEDRNAKKMARAIVSARPIHTTFELQKAVWGKIPFSPRGKKHPATRLFQAIRIAVNDELTELESLLSQIPKWLTMGGRCVMISFHTLEDRIIKHAFKHLAESHTPKNRYQPQESSNTHLHRTFHVLTPKPICPSQEEITINPKARSAKLRAIVCCSHT